MSKIRILYIETCGRTYGGPRSLIDILRNLDRNRFKPFLMFPREAEFLKEIPTDVEMFETKLASKSVKRKAGTVRDLINTATILIELTRLIKKEGIHLIHANTYKAALVSVIPSKVAGIPLIWHDRYLLSHGVIDTLLANAVNRIIAISKAVAQNRTDNQDKVTVVYNAVELNHSPLNDGSNYRKNLGFGESDFLVGTVGRLCHLKGQKYLIKAAAQVIKDVQAKFVIVGDSSLPEDIKYISSLHELVKELDLEEHIVFTGYRRDVLEITRLFDVAVIPSLTEGFGRTVAEAMSLGVPVIATNVGGIPEIIEDGISGFLVPPAEPVNCANKIIELAKDDRKRREIGISGRKRIKEHFSVSKMIEGIQTVYEEILAC